MLDLQPIRNAIEKETERELAQRAVKEYRDRKAYLRKNWPDLPANRIWLAKRVTLAMINDALKEQIDYLNNDPCASGLGILTTVRYVSKILQALPLEYERQTLTVQCRKRIATLEKLARTDPTERAQCQK